MLDIITRIVKKIDKTKVDFIYLIGSYSRNEQNEFSDIDIIIALKEGYDSYRDNQFIDGIYVSLNYDSASEMKKNYTDPLKYIRGHIGIKDMVLLYDSENKAEDFLNMCFGIDYKKDFEDKIQDYVNNETIDWIEEVNKAVNGFLFNNHDKMLAGLYGITYGMLDVLSVSEGIIRDKIGVLSTFRNYFGENEVKFLLESAFGVDSYNLKERTFSGLLLYLEIIKIISYRFNKMTSENVLIALKNIEEAIKDEEVVS